MKKTLLICGALLALTASLASAQGGVNLSWNDCGSFGQLNRTFACNTNTGSPSSDIMVGSYVIGATNTAVTGNEMILDLQTDSPLLPDWWQFKNTGACRQTALNFSFDFSTNTNCFDYYGSVGGSSGGINAYQSAFGGPNRARIKMVVAVSQAAAGPIDPAVEVYSFKLLLGHARTVGTGACAGCQIPACVVLNEIKVTQPVGAGDFRLTSPLNAQHVLWQGGGAVNCPGATSARSATWGSIKSLYR